MLTTVAVICFDSYEFRCFQNDMARSGYLPFHRSSMAFSIAESDGSLKRFVCALNLDSLRGYRPAEYMTVGRYYRNRRMEEIIDYLKSINAEQRHAQDYYFKKEQISITDPSLADSIQDID